MKLKGYDRHKKDEKKETNFEAINGEDVVTKAYLDKKLLKIDSHLSVLGKDYNEYKLRYNKQSVEKMFFKEL